MIDKITIAFNMFIFARHEHFYGVLRYKPRVVNEQQIFHLLDSVRSSRRRYEIPLSGSIQDEVETCRYKFLVIDRVEQFC